MKLIRCENQHLYPVDEYESCPFCTGSANKRTEKKSVAAEKSYEIESAGPSVYTDRILTKKDLEEMRAKANREYIETHPLHVNTRSENLKNGVSGFFDKLYMVWDVIMTTPVGRFIAFIGEIIAESDDCD